MPSTIRQLTITDTACDLVLREITRSSISDPVVALVQETAPMRTDREISELIRSGASDDAIRSRAIKLYGEDLSMAPWKLVPHVHSRGEQFFPKEFLIEASGIWFCFPPPLIQAMSGWILDAKNGGLILSDRDGMTIMPTGRLAP